MKIRMIIKTVYGTISLIVLVELSHNYQIHDETVMGAVPQNNHTHKFVILEPARYSFVAPVSGSTIDIRTINE